MELWIRNQARTGLMRVSNVFIEENTWVSQGHLFVQIYTYMDDSKYYLGEYHTMKQALKVLDEIQDLLQNAYAENANRIVYQMPEVIENIYENEVD